MPYYLSYIEIDGGHAALMLSEQKDPSQPTKILTEIGFAYTAEDKPTDDFRRYFTTHEGIISTEENSSRVLYGHNTVKHRTYEISREEMKRFLEMFSSDIDDAKNVSPEIYDELKKESKLGSRVAYPNYQLMKFNCKTFVMSTLKEIGIMDASELSNSFVQRTKTNQKLLQTISKDELAAPAKDVILDELTKVLADIQAALLLLQSDKNNYQNPNIRGALEFIDLINQEKNKIKIDTITRNIQQIPGWIRILATNIEEMQKKPGVKYPPEFNKEKFHLQTLYRLAGSIDELERSKSLDFFWKTSPPISKRLHLENFTEQEQAVYKVKIQYNEMIDGLDRAMLLIQSKLDESKNIDKETQSDMAAFKDMLAATKKSITEGQTTFTQSMQDRKNEDIVTACLEQKKFLNAELSKLETQINNFKPQSTKETSGIKKAIQSMISYLKKDYHFALDKSAKNSLLKHVSLTRDAANQDKYYSASLTKQGAFNKKLQKDSTAAATASPPSKLGRR